MLTFNEADMPILKRLMSQPVEPIVRVGLAPTYEQVFLQNCFIYDFFLVFFYVQTSLDKQEFEF